MRAPCSTSLHVDPWAKKTRFPRSSGQSSRSPARSMRVPGEYLQVDGPTDVAVTRMGFYQGAQKRAACAPGTPNAYGLAVYLCNDMHQDTRPSVRASANTTRCRKAASLSFFPPGRSVAQADMRVKAAGWIRRRAM